MKMKMKQEARPDTPSLGEVQEAVRVLDATSPEEESARLEALAVVQKAADVVTPRRFAPSICWAPA